MRSAALLLLALVVVACARPDPGPSGWALSVALPGGGLLRVAGSEQTGAQWFHQQGLGLREIPAPPVALFPVSAVPSPDGRFLAVLSVGEGHPVLDLLELRRVLGGSHGTQSLRTIDPYPGGLELLGWEGNRLKVSSDRPLAECCDAMGRIPGDDVSGQAVTFFVDPATGAVRPD